MTFDGNLLFDKANIAFPYGFKTLATSLQISRGLIKYSMLTALVTISKLLSSNGNWA